MEKPVCMGKIPDKMGGEKAELLGKIKITLWPNLLGVCGGVFSQHVLDLPEAHQHYCHEHDLERGTAHSEGSLSLAQHPALGRPAALSPRTQEGESSSGPPGSSTCLKMPVTGVERLFILP